MCKKIMMIALLCCLDIAAMERCGDFVIKSADGYEYSCYSHHVEQLAIFDPKNNPDRLFLSQHTYSEIEEFFSAVTIVKSIKIGPRLFNKQYNIAVLQTERMSLESYAQFDLRLDSELKENKKVMLLMSLAGELRAEQLAVVFLSSAFNQKDHKKMFTALISSEKNAMFEAFLYKKINKDRRYKLDQQLSFAQRVFLYGMYERIQLEKLNYEQWIQYPRVAPRMTGYVEKFIIDSLPEKLKKEIVNL